MKDKLYGYSPIGAAYSEGSPYYPLESTKGIPYFDMNAFNHRPNRSFLAGNPKQPSAFFTCIREGEFVHSLEKVTAYVRSHTLGYYKFDVGCVLSLHDFCIVSHMYTCYCFEEFLAIIAEKAAKKPAKYGELWDYVIKEYM